MSLRVNRLNSPRFCRAETGRAPSEAHLFHLSQSDASPIGFIAKTKSFFIEHSMIFALLGTFFIVGGFCVYNAIFNPFNGH